MKRLLIVGALGTLLTLLSALHASAQTQVGPGASVLWEYVKTEVDQGIVTRLELRIDSADFSPVGLPNRSDHPNGADYTFSTTVPPLLVGKHTVGVRACNEFVCGPEATVEFNLVIMPSAPKTLRIGLKPQE